MKPQLETEVEQLNSAFLAWREVYPSLQTNFTLQGKPVSTNDLNNLFTEIVSLLKFIGDKEDINSVLLANNQSNINSLITSISQNLPNLPANPQSYLEQLASLLWSLRTAIVWLTPQDTKEYFQNWIQNVDVLGKIDSTKTLLDILDNSTENVNKSVAEITQLASTAQELVSKLTGYDREASNAKTTAEASATTAVANKDNINSLLSELNDGITKHKELLDKINNLSNQAEMVLEGNIKDGLAKSFGNRKESLEKAQDQWSKAFFISITSILVLVIFTTTGVIHLPALLNAQGQIDGWGIIARVLVTGPAIWFTWFAGRQYGHTMRLVEDYAFKEASALAFVGYKNEMSEDSETMKLLRETAIKNFGASPTRLLSKSEPSSPVHELVDKALDNQGFFDRALELLKVLIPGRN